jgi:hypothetical protein
MEQRDEGNRCSGVIRGSTRTSELETILATNMVASRDEKETEKEEENPLHRDLAEIVDVERASNSRSAMRNCPGPASGLTRNEQSRKEACKSQPDERFSTSANGQFQTPQQVESLIDLNSDSESSIPEAGTVGRESTREQAQEYSQTRGTNHRGNRHQVDCRAQRTTAWTGPYESNAEDVGEDGDLARHVEYLLQENLRLRSLLEEEQPPAQLPPSFWKVLHRVHCAGEAEKRMYTDEPYQSKYSNGQCHLCGRDEVKNIDLFIERHKEFAFIVYIDYRCTGHYNGLHAGGWEDIGSLGMPGEGAKLSRRSAQRKGPARGNGDIEPQRSRRQLPDEDDFEATTTSAALVITCDVLHEGLLNLLSQNSVFKFCFHYTEDTQEFPVPFLAYYHFHDAIQDALRGLDDEEERKQLQLLSTFIMQTYSNEFAHVGNMFDRGVVTMPFLKYLFVPNEIVLAVTKGQTTGHIQQGFLEFSPGHLSTPMSVEAVLVGAAGGEASESVEKPQVASLKVKNWGFNGEFIMQMKNLSIDWDIPAKQEREIAKLNVYPLRFASDDLKAHLAARGRTFWECRKNKYVNYEHDINNIQNSVS